MFERKGVSVPSASKASCSTGQAIKSPQPKILNRPRSKSPQRLPPGKRSSSANKSPPAKRSPQLKKPKYATAESFNLFATAMYGLMTDVNTRLDEANIHRLPRTLER